MRKELTTIILASTIALGGCGATGGSKRPTIYDSANYGGSTLDYFAESAQRKTSLDAAETDREARCLKAMYGVGYPDYKVFYEKLSTCVGNERASDMAKYLPISVVIDGIKVWGLLGGIKNVSNSIGGGNSSASTTTVGRESVTRTIGDFTN